MVRHGVCVTGSVGGIYQVSLRPLHLMQEGRHGDGTGLILEQLSPLPESLGSEASSADPWRGLQPLRRHRFLLEGLSTKGALVSRAQQNSQQCVGAPDGRAGPAGASAADRRLPLLHLRWELTSKGVAELVGHVPDMW